MPISRRIARGAAFRALGLAGFVAAALAQTPAGAQVTAPAAVPEIPPAPAPATAPAPAPDAPPASAKVTYAGGVAQIIFHKCVQCHRPGQVAPMSFMKFSEVRPYAKSIKKVLREGTMPPWFAEPSHTEFSNDPRLTPEEIKLISAWVDQGATMGDPYDMPPTPKFDDAQWAIGKPDAVFTMPKAFPLPDALEDHYQSVIVPTGLTEDKWLTSMQLRPGNMSVVHHILVFAIPPGMEGGAKALGGDFLLGALSGGGMIAKYAPGNNPDIYPAGYGKKLAAKSSLLFQIHYHKAAGPGTATTDQSSMGVRFSSEPLEHPVTTAWILNPLISIPPNKDGVRSSSAFQFTDDGYIYSLFPHMHYRGKAFSFEAVYPDGKTEKLLNVPAYNFDWQLSYMYRDLKFIPKGTKIKATGVYDNTSANSFNPDPNQAVSWGEETTDEMMLGLMDYVYVTDKDKQGMIGLPDGLAAMLPPELQGVAKGSVDLRNIDVSKIVGNLGAKLPIKR